MASLIISYYSAIARDCAKAPHGSVTVTTSGTSAQSAAVTGPVVAMLYSDVAHYFNDGADPTASAATGGYLPADTPLWLALGAGNKIAAITA